MPAGCLSAEGCSSGHPAARLVSRRRAERRLPHLGGDRRGGEEPGGKRRGGHRPRLPAEPAGHLPGLCSGRRACRTLGGGSCGRMENPAEGLCGRPLGGGLSGRPAWRKTPTSSPPCAVSRNVPTSRSRSFPNARTAASCKAWPNRRIPRPGWCGSFSGRASCPRTTPLHRLNRIRRNLRTVPPRRRRNRPDWKNTAPLRPAGKTRR